MNLLVSLFFPSAGGALSLNALELFIGGIDNQDMLPSSIPASSRSALRGCFEDLRFISYSTSAEPPETINFDTQVRNER